MPAELGLGEWSKILSSALDFIFRDGTKEDIKKLQDILGDIESQLKEAGVGLNSPEGLSLITHALALEKIGMRLYNLDKTSGEILSKVGKIEKEQRAQAEGLGGIRAEVSNINEKINEKFSNINEKISIINENINRIEETQKKDSKVLYKIEGMLAVMLENNTRYNPRARLATLPGVETRDFEAEKLETKDVMKMFEEALKKIKNEGDNESSG